MDMYPRSVFCSSKHLTLCQKLYALYALCPMLYAFSLHTLLRLDIKVAAQYPETFSSINGKRAVGIFHE